MNQLYAFYETHFKYNKTEMMKVKIWKNTYHVNSMYKKARVARLIS